MLVRQISMHKILLYFLLFACFGLWLYGPLFSHVSSLKMFRYFGLLSLFSKLIRLSLYISYMNKMTTFFYRIFSGHFLNHWTSILMGFLPNKKKILSFSLRLIFSFLSFFFLLSTERKYLKPQKKSKLFLTTHNKQNEHRKSTRFCDSLGRFSFFYLVYFMLRYIEETRELGKKWTSAERVM